MTSVSTSMMMSAFTLLLFYAVMGGFVVMLWKLTKDLAHIKRALADLQHAVELLAPRPKPGD
jgi:hypothetical protein